jgi:hypothetical protein
MLTIIVVLRYLNGDILPIVTHRLEECQRDIAQVHHALD